MGKIDAQLNLKLNIIHENKIPIAFHAFMIFHMNKYYFFQKEECKYFILEKFVSPTQKNHYLQA